MEISKRRAAVLMSAMLLSGCAGDDCLFVPGGTHKDYSTGQPGQQMPGRVIGKCKGPELPAYDPMAEAKRRAERETPFAAEADARGRFPSAKENLGSAYEFGGFYYFGDIVTTVRMPKDPKKAEYWYRLALKEEKDLESNTYEKAYEGLMRLGADMSGLSTPRTRKYTVK